MPQRTPFIPLRLAWWHVPDLVRDGERRWQKTGIEGTVPLLIRPLPPCPIRGPLRPSPGISLTY
jgi:hypothetical protein